MGTEKQTTLTFPNIYIIIKILTFFADGPPTKVIVPYKEIDDDKLI